MKTLILTLLLLASISGATTHQIIGGVTTGNLTNSAAGWQGVVSTNTEQAVADAQTCALVPTAGLIDAMYFRTSVAPGTGKSWTVTIWKSTGSPCSGGSDQAITLTIQDSATTGSDTNVAHSVSVSAGNYIAIHITPASTPTAGTASWAVRFTPTTDNETVMFASQHNALAATFLSLTCPGLATATENATYTLMPTGGTVKTLYAQAASAAGAGNAWTWTVDKDSSPSLVTATASNSNALQSDVTHTSTVTAGNSIDIGVAVTGTPSTSDIYVSVVFVPTTTGDFIIPMTRASSGFNSASTTYGILSGRIAAQNGTETIMQQMMPAMTIKAIYAYATNDIGSGKSYTFKLRKAAADASPTLSCTASGGGAAPPSICNGSATVSISDFDLLDTAEIPSGTPTAPTALHVSYLGTLVAPAASSVRHHGIGGLL